MPDKPVLSRGPRHIGGLALLCGVLLVAGCTHRAAPTPPPGPGDPTDARNITLTLTVTPEQISMTSVSLGVGVAPGHGNQGGAVRIRTLTAKGEEIRAFTISDPLARHVYTLTNQVTRRRGTVPDLRHTTVARPSLTIVLYLPLEARTSTVEAAWIGQPAQRFDLVSQIREACSADKHPDCAAWRAAHP